MTYHPAAARPEEIKEFPEYQGLLWRTLGTLARRGHFVPPDEGRDVIHDFYLEAWDGVRNRHQPSLGAFSTYVVGAFVRFAKRRLAQMQAYRNRFVDFDSQFHLASDLSPLDRLESTQQVELVRSALDKLPGLQRQCLVAYVSNEGATERELAQRAATSRHTVRKALAEGLANLARAYADNCLSQKDADLLALAWEDGRVSEDIALRVGMSPSEVRKKRQEFARNTLETLRASIQHTAPRKEKAMTTQEVLKRALLDQDRDYALHDLKAHADAVREALTSDGLDELHLTEQERSYLAESPERLAEVYEIVFPWSHDGHEDEASRAAAAFTISRLNDVNSAFEDMAEVLPDGLRNWERFLPALNTSFEEVRRVRNGAPEGSAAYRIARYGLDPEVFAQVWGGFALLFEQIEMNPRALREASLLIRRDDSLVPVTLGDLVASAEETPGLPDIDGVADGLSRWTLEALPVLPLLIPGYRVRSSNRGLVADTFTVRDVSTSARWTRRAMERAAFI